MKKGDFCCIFAADYKNICAELNARKAAEHEPISRNRVKGASEINNPRLSMLLTGTFGQYKALVPSVENGYFSRLLTVVIRGTNGFDKRYVQSKGGQSAVPKIVGNRVLRTYESLMNAVEREWSLTDAQKERLGEHLETEYGTLIDLLGKNFHSAVVRMAVQIERMAHDIERICYHPEEYGKEDIEQARIWQQKYVEYRETIPKGSTCYKHFYGWMFTEIYRGMREDFCKKTCICQKKAVPLQRI